MTLLQMILHVLNRSLGMVLILCHMVIMHNVHNTQQGFCEAHPSADQMASKYHHPNWNTHAPTYFHPHTTSTSYLAIWFVESSEASLWKHHCQELVELVDPGISFKEGRYPVHQMLNHTKKGGIMNIRYDTSHWRDAFHIPDNGFWGSNYSMFQISSCFPSFCPISISHNYHLLEVLPIVSQLPSPGIPFSKWQSRCFIHWAIGLLDWVQLNVFNIVSHSCTDVRIIFLNLTVRTQHTLSSIENSVERTKYKLEHFPKNITMVDLLFLHRRCFSVFFDVIFRRNGKKCSEHVCKIWRLWSNHWVNVSKTHIYWPFLLVARTVCKMCQLWTAM